MRSRHRRRRRRRFFLLFLFPSSVHNHNIEHPYSTPSMVRRQSGRPLFDSADDLPRPLPRGVENIPEHPVVIVVVVAAAAVDAVDVVAVVVGS